MNWRLCIQRRFNVGVFVLLIASVGSCVVGRTEPLPTEAHIRLAITPGKPSAPTETIIVTKRGTHYRLRVKRNDANSQKLADSEVTLPLTEFASLWDIIEKEQLTAFQPLESDTLVFDFGERILELKWQPKTGDKMQSHSVKWIKELNNKDNVRPLFQAMANLADSYVTTVPLYYFNKGSK